MASSGERRMLFDTRGKRKHVIRVVYAILALLMGASLFLVVGPFNIANLIGNSSSSSSAANVLHEQAERIERRLAKSPEDEQLLLQLTRARINAGNAADRTDVGNGAARVHAGSEEGLRSSLGSLGQVSEAGRRTERDGGAAARQHLLPARGIEHHGGRSQSNTSPRAPGRRRSPPNSRRASAASARWRSTSTSTGNTPPPTRRRSRRRRRPARRRKRRASKNSSPNTANAARPSPSRRRKSPNSKRKPARKP